MNASNDDPHVELPRDRHKVSQIALATLTVFWLGAVVFGMAWMWKYEATPGEATKSLVHWPVDSGIERSADRPTVVLFAHPRCPCTRASIRELAIVNGSLPRAR
ncbi:MAG: hypothetical protein HOL01_10030 [Planctomycetaceae bacterium]|nr:hypothetical protein [Planctomycetaceae bacterium]